MRPGALINLVVLSLAGCTCVEEEPYVDPPRTVVGVVEPPRRDGGSVDAGNFDGGLSDGGLCRSTCGAELQTVIDCQGRERPCSAGDGCLDGQCVPACLAVSRAQSTVGCEFYVGGIPPELATRGSCHALYIANVWNTPARPQLKRGTLSAPIDTFRLPKRNMGGAMEYLPLPRVSGRQVIPPGEVAIAFLYQGVLSKPGEYFVGCPAGVRPATDTFQFEESKLSDAFELTTDTPVIVTDIYPYGGADSHVTSSALLLPAAAWGTQHLAVSPAGPIAEPGDPDFPNFQLQPYLQLISNDDDTEIAITPTVALNSVAGALSYTAPGTTRHFRLRAGKVLQLSADAPLDGTTIVSSHPIGVLAGHPCQFIPSGYPACDSMHLQLPATSFLASRAVGVRYPSRSMQDEETLWRIVAAADGTRLTWTPGQPDAGPSQLRKGESVEFFAAGPFLVESQDALHPILLTEFMTGGSGFSGSGDPEWVPIVAPEQWLTRYVFFTDPTYPRTALVFVREKTAANTFEPVTLDCGPMLAWTPIAGTRMEYSILQWNRGDAQGCPEGTHTAKSKAPFGLTVWGTEWYTSYGFPAGMGVRPLNSVSIE